MAVKKWKAGSGIMRQHVNNERGCGDAQKPSASSRSRRSRTGVKMHWPLGRGVVTLHTFQNPGRHRVHLTTTLLFAAIAATSSIKSHAQCCQCVHMPLSHNADSQRKACRVMTLSSSESSKPAETSLPSSDGACILSTLYLQRIAGKSKTEIIAWTISQQWPRCERFRNVSKHNKIRCSRLTLPLVKKHAQSPKQMQNIHLDNERLPT